MRLRFLCLCAAGLLVAACATEPEESSAISGGGVAGSSSSPAAPTLNVTEIPASKAGSSAHWVANVGDRIFFDFDMSDISAASIDTLNKQAAWLKVFPKVMLTLEGHADERGTREYNLALAERRANSMKEFLVSKGISANRLDTISYGKERPAVLGSNDEAWAQNRRAVGVIKSGGAS
jgi:peptidoglycan-associated lipoprotein